MPLPNVGKPVRTSMRQSGSLWYLEWTYTGSAGEVLLDATTSDVDARVVTPVADSGVTGTTLIRFPKCRRVRIVHMSIQAAVTGTSEKQMTPGPIVPTSGTMTVVFCTAPSTLADPPTGARARLHLLLDYN